MLGSSPSLLFFWQLKGYNMKFWIAKIFGKRVDVDEKPYNGDAGIKMTAYQFLGKLWVTNYSRYF